MLETSLAPTILVKQFTPPPSPTLFASADSKGFKSSFSVSAESKGVRALVGLEVGMFGSELPYHPGAFVRLSIDGSCGMRYL